MERVNKVPLIQVQKKHEIFMDASVVDYLPLIDGLADITIGSYVGFPKVHFFSN